jgi:hypothetical protein
MPLYTSMLSRVRSLKVWGTDTSAAYLNAGSYRDILINNDHSNAANRHWAAYGAYISTLLNNQGMRYPNWYSSGVYSVFAETSVIGDRVIIGVADRGLLQRLNRGQLIPMRTFLSLKGNDPQLHDSNFASLYEA